MVVTPRQPQGHWPQSRRHKGLCAAGHATWSLPAHKRLGVKAEAAAAATAARVAVAATVTAAAFMVAAVAATAVAAAIVVSVTAAAGRSGEIASKCCTASHSARGAEQGTQEGRNTFPAFPWNAAQCHAPRRPQPSTQAVLRTCTHTHARTHMRPHTNLLLPHVHQLQRHLALGQQIAGHLQAWGGRDCVGRQGVQVAQRREKECARDGRRGMRRGCWVHEKERKVHSAVGRLGGAGSECNIAWGMCGGGSATAPPPPTPLGQLRTHTAAAPAAHLLVHIDVDAPYLQAPGVHHLWPRPLPAQGRVPLHPLRVGLVHQ